MDNNNSNVIELPSINPLNPAGQAQAQQAEQVAAKSGQVQETLASIPSEAVPEPTAEDVTPDGFVRMVTPQGQPLKINMSDYHVAAIEHGYQLRSVVEKRLTSTPTQLLPGDVVQGKYNMVRPGTEEQPVNDFIPQDQLEEKRRQGYTFNSENQANQTEAHQSYNILHQYLVNHLGETGAQIAESSVTALSSALFDAPQAIVDASGVDPRMFQDLKEKYPAAETGGKIANFADSMMLGDGLAGLVPEAAEGATLISRLGTSALKGMAFSSPQALAQLVIDKDPLSAVETTLLSGGLNAVLDIGASSLEKAAAKSAEKAVSTELTENQIQAALDKLHLSPADKVELGENRYFQGNTPVERQSDALKKLVNPDYELMPENGKFKDFARNIQQAASEDNITPLLKKVDDATTKEVSYQVGFNKDKVLTDLERLKYSDYGDAFKEKEASTVDSLMNKISKYGEETKVPYGKRFSGARNRLTMAESQSLLKLIDKDGAIYSSDTAVNHVFQQVASVVRQERNEAMERLAVENKMPEVAAEWAKQRARFAVAKTFEAGASKALNQNVWSQVREMLPIGHGSGLAIFGHLASHAVGLPSAVGIPVTMGANMLLRHSIKNQGWNAMKRFWQGQVGNTAASSLMVVEGMRVLAQKLKQIRPLLLAMSNERIKDYSPPNVMNQVLGDEATGLSKAKQFDLIAHKITQLVNDKNYQSSHQINIFNDLATNHPEFQAQIAAQHSKILEMLYRVMPKNPNGPAPPFSHQEEWKPTSDQIDEFNRYLDLARDPSNVIKLLHANKLSQKDVQFVSACNPQVLGAIQAEVLKHSQDAKIDLNYQQKLQTGYLLGMQIVEGLANTHVFQQSWMNSNIASTSSAPTGKGRAGHNIKVENLPSMASTFHGGMNQK